MRVYYDGACIVCSKEMDIYRKKDSHGRLKFVDISASNFSARGEGLDPKLVHEVFHVKDSKGNLHQGVSGFLAIWKELEIFKALSFLAQSPLFRPLFDIGYWCFIKARPFLPRKNCDQGVCGF